MVDELPRQRVLNFLQAFYGGDDVAAALRYCDDDIESMVYLPVELFPHLGPRRGKAAIAELMEIHQARYSARRFEVKFLVADEARAAAIIDLTFIKRSDRRVLQLPSGNFFTLRRGLIVELRSFFDTVDMIEQLSGKELVGPLLRETGATLRPPLPAEPSGAR
ncbi:MAG: nuclear transport factor 2 family protein [bacterium]|nr:nuclear transport factor 2 family protein [bacterium]